MRARLVTVAVTVALWWPLQLAGQDAPTDEDAAREPLPIEILATTGRAEFQRPDGAWRALVSGRDIRVGMPSVTRAASTISARAADLPVDFGQLSVFRVVESSALRGEQVADADPGTPGPVVDVVLEIELFAGNLTFGVEAAAPTDLGEPASGEPVADGDGGADASVGEGAAAADGAAGFSWHVLVQTPLGLVHADDAVFGVYGDTVICVRGTLSVDNALGYRRTLIAGEATRMKPAGRIPAPVASGATPTPALRATLPTLAP